VNKHTRTLTHSHYYFVHYRTTQIMTSTENSMKTVMNLMQKITSRTDRQSVLNFFQHLSCC